MQQYLLFCDYCLFGTRTNLYHLIHWRQLCASLPGRHIHTGNWYLLLWKVVRIEITLFLSRSIMFQPTWNLLFSHTVRMPRGAPSPSGVRVPCRPCLIPGIEFNGGGGQVVTPRWALGLCRIRIYPIPTPIPIIRFLRNDNLFEKTVVGQSEHELFLLCDALLEYTVRNSIEKLKKKTKEEN
jgi:hypothetical protein